MATKNPYSAEYSQWNNQQANKWSAENAAQNWNQYLPNNFLETTPREITVNKISFETLWDNYPQNKVEHINKDGNDEFKDHCAINMSHSLFLSGVLLDNFKGAKCYANCPLGKNQHSLRAEELANWLSKNKKKFNLIRFHELNGEKFEEGIKSKTGIIFFKDYWRRDGESGETRTGDHIDLWNKNELAGEGLLSTWARLNFPDIYDFFGSSDLRRSKTVWLWEIK